MLGYKKVSTIKGKSEKDIKKLADFRTELADTLCRYHRRPENKRGSPSTNSRREETLEPSPKDQG